MSLRRAFAIRERLRLEISANATNVLSHTGLNGNYNGGLGSTSSYGTIDTRTFDLRHVVMLALYSEPDMQEVSE
jgi:hypothetical protein